ncbi:unnamed protein product [Rhizophagus irregularis]|nr:unnamed protein product [Rhizophagus irregularis]
MRRAWDAIHDEKIIEYFKTCKIPTDLNGSDSELEISDDNDGNKIDDDDDEGSDDASDYGYDIIGSMIMMIAKMLVIE